MKNKWIAFSLVLLLLLNFACKKTSIEPSPIANETEGLFLPTKVNSAWTYDTGVVKSVITITNNYKSVFGKQYNEYTMVYNSVSSKAYYAYSKKEYTSLYTDTAGSQEITYLKESPALGQKWNDTIAVASSQVIYKYEVLETNASVNNVTVSFSNVVHVKLSIGSTYTNDAYYVKGVGLVKSVTNNNSVITTSLLKSYTVL
jgi:hypothetical protein